MAAAEGKIDEPENYFTVHYLARAQGMFYFAPGEGTVDANGIYLVNEEHGPLNSQFTALVEPRLRERLHNLGPLRDVPQGEARKKEIARLRLLGRPTAVVQSWLRVGSTLCSSFVVRYDDPEYPVNKSVWEVILSIMTDPAWAQPR